VNCRSGLLIGVELFIGSADASEVDCKESKVTANVRMPLLEQQAFFIRKGGERQTFD
jgi:hypothetical protein